MAHDARREGSRQDCWTRALSLLLEKARIEDPWELITNPTLLPNPIEPRKKRIIAIGGILGIFVGAITALIIEKRKDILRLWRRLRRGRR